MSDEASLVSRTHLPGCKASSIRPDVETKYTMETKPVNAGTSEKMKSVKAIWDKALAGPKNDAALKHDQAAGKAQAARQDAEGMRELDAAAAALA